ncbi:hypothetical protein D3C75_825660 [compost metagenome]
MLGHFLEEGLGLLTVRLSHGVDLLFDARDRDPRCLNSLTTEDNQLIKRARKLVGEATV